MASGPGGKKVRSDRAGGLYRITDSAAATVKHLTVAEKASLTSWIVDQRRAGEEAPLVNTGAVETAKTRRALRHSERKTRFFDMLSDVGWKVSDTLKLGGSVDEKYKADRGRLQAWCELAEPESSRSG